MKRLPHAEALPSPHATPDLVLKIDTTSHIQEQISICQCVCVCKYIYIYIYIYSFNLLYF